MLALPLVVVVALYFAVWQYQSATIDNWTLLPAILLLTLLYIFNREIDRWWWRRHAPALDEQIGTWLSAHSPFLRSLDGELRKRFIDRLSIFMRIKDFTLKMERDYQLQEEFKAMVAHEYIRLTLHREQYQFRKFENFVIYNHPFGSPLVQELHCVEVNEVDGVVILSRPQLTEGFDPTQGRFNIALYAAILSFIDLHGDEAYPDVSAVDVSHLISDMFGWQMEYLHAHLGSVVTPSALAMLMYCYIMNPEKASALYPDQCERIHNILYHV